MKTYDSRAGYDLYAPDYRKDHPHLDSFDWDQAQAILAQAVAEQLERGRPVRLLDIGCGDGRALKRLVRLRDLRRWDRDLSFQGWDISENMLRQARKVLPADVALLRHDLLDQAPPNGQFELACSFFVLVHIDHPGDFLAAAKAVLKPGGAFVFNNIPQREGLVLESKGHQFQIEWFHHEAEAVADAIAEQGLELEDELATEWSTLYRVRVPE